MKSDINNINYNIKTVIIKNLVNIINNNTIDEIICVFEDDMIWYDINMLILKPEYEGKNELLNISSID